MKSRIKLWEFMGNEYSHLGFNACPCYGEDRVIRKFFSVVGVADSPICIEFGETRVLGTTTRLFRVEFQSDALFFSSSLSIKCRLLNIIDIILASIRLNQFKLLKFFHSLPFKFFARPDSIGSFICSRYSGAEIDFIVVDIDSHDFDCAKNILDNGILPKLFCVEYNPSLGKELSVKLKAEIKLHSANRRVYGCSAKALVSLFEKFGYKHVFTSGFCNLYFARADVSERFEEASIEADGTWTVSEIESYIDNWCLQGFLPSWHGCEPLTQADIDANFDPVFPETAR